MIYLKTLLVGIVGALVAGGIPLAVAMAMAPQAVVQRSGIYGLVVITASYSDVGGRGMLVAAAVGFVLAGAWEMRRLRGPRT